MDWTAAKDRWLSSLLLSMEDVVEGHMTDMLSFGGPICEKRLHDGRSRGWEMFEQYIQICQHEMQSLNNLVTSFLILARQNETGNSQNEIVELRPLMERVYELSKHYVMEKDARLSFSYAEPHVQVWAIPSYVEQICLHLIKNAIDAVAHNGSVTIYTETSPQRSFVSVTIEDNGCGISEQRQKHLFEPFYITKVEILFAIPPG